MPQLGTGDQVREGMTMLEGQWEKFFALLQQIRDLPYATWQEKLEVVKRKAEEYDAESALEEFAGWFQE